MDLCFDNVIIGAGPSGISCGITLQKNNSSVCVIDKAVFPRDKTCGGLVTKKTELLIRSLFDHDSDKMESLFQNTVSSVSIYNRKELLVTADVTDPMHFTDRRSFDNTLVLRFKELGGKIFEGEKNYKIDKSRKQIFLSGERIIRYKNLIFADGALTQVQKKDRKLAFGIETWISPELLPLHGMSLHFGYGSEGYLWVFPYRDRICVGACSRYKGGKGASDPKEMLKEFLRECGIDPEAQKYRGAFFPCGYTRPQNQLPENQILLGDAAGFADPISGEGLYFALRSGILAAEALSGPDFKQTYLNSVRPIRRIIHDGRRLESFFFLPKIQNRFLQKVRGNQLFISRFFDSFVADYSYSYNKMFSFYRAYKKEKRK